MTEVPVAISSHDISIQLLGMMESFIINVSYAGHTLIRNYGLAIYKHQIYELEMKCSQNRPTDQKVI